MKKRILFLLLLMSVIISYAQKSENNIKFNNCFTNSEIDSIYFRIVENKYYRKQVPILEKTIVEYNKMLEEQKVQITVLTEQKQNLNTIILENEKIIRNDVTIISNYEKSIKSEKKKKISVFLKGVGVGSVAVVVIKFLVLK